MFDYDLRGELASRDIVSRSIETELKKSGEECVFLDCTHLEMNAFQKHFPAITQYCLLQGIDVSKDWIPVVPTQHYLRSEEHTSELQSRPHLVCRLLLEKKK